MRRAAAAWSSAAAPAAAPRGARGAAPGRGGDCGLGGPGLRGGVVRAFRGFLLFCKELAKVARKNGRSGKFGYKKRLRVCLRYQSCRGEVLPLCGGHPGAG